MPSVRKDETVGIYLDARVCFMDLGPGSEVTRGWEACPGVRAAARNCALSKWTCGSTGSSMASVWRWATEEAEWQPVTTRRAAFCTL